MAVKRYIADADNTITNALRANLKTRGTGANMGASDVLETFSLYGQASGSTGLTSELSRILIKFPVQDMSTDRTNGVVPASGSVKWILRMFNAEHSQTLPRDFTLNVYAISRSWQEGTGLDMEEYTDLTNDGEGSNWENAGLNNQWSTPGGDFLVSGSGETDAKAYTVNFAEGTEDLELDISELVEEWMDGGSIENYGVAVFLSGTQEAFFSGSGLTVQGGDFGTGAPSIPIDHSTYTATPAASGNVLFNITGSTRSYFTKKFFARGSEFFFKRPCIEARFDDTIRDDRGQFFFSSSLTTDTENLNTLYLYNVVRGRLKNIPKVGTSNIFVTLFSGSDFGADKTSISGGFDDNPPTKLIQSVPIEAQNICDGLDTATGSHDSTGIYKCDICLTASSTDKALTVIHDVWHSADLKSSTNETYFTGTIRPLHLSASQFNPTDTFVTTITNLKNSYFNEGKARFRMYIRPKDWNPNIFTKATKTTPNTIVNSGSYRVFRTIDDLDIIAYGTGSEEDNLRHTHLSYDSEGNYFDLHMDLFEPGFSYALKFAYYSDSIGSWIEQPEIFKFRVET